MMLPPFAAMIADTLLVRPVDVPTPWYSVASGVLSIIVTLLLLGIAVALLGMARALKGAERNLGGRLQGLADELIPLARNLNQIATQLSEVTTAAREDLRTLSGTVGAVDDAVRDTLAAGEARLQRFGTLLDAVQDEAQATVASATGLVRGVRTGAGSLVSNLFTGGKGKPTAPSRASRRNGHDDTPPRTDADVYARLAALEAAFAEQDEEEEDFEDDIATVARGAERSDAEAWSDDDDDDELFDDDDDEFDDDDDEPDVRGAFEADVDDEDEDDDLDDEDDALDDEDDDLDDDDDDDDDDDGFDADDADAAPPSRDRRDEGARHGGPRIRPRGRE